MQKQMDRAVVLSDTDHTLVVVSDGMFRMPANIWTARVLGAAQADNPEKGICSFTQRYNESGVDSMRRRTSSRAVEPTTTEFPFLIGIALRLGPFVGAAASTGELRGYHP